MSTTPSAPRGEPVGPDHTPVEPHMRSVAGVLGPPPRRPDPGRSWDDLVEEAAAAEYLADQRRAGGEPSDDGD